MAHPFCKRRVEVQVIPGISSANSNVLVTVSDFPWDIVPAQSFEPFWEASEAQAAYAEAVAFDSAAAAPALVVCAARLLFAGKLDATYSAHNYADQFLKRCRQEEML